MSVRSDIAAGVALAVAAIGGSAAEAGYQYRTRSSAFSEGEAFGSWADIVGVFTERGSGPEYEDGKRQTVEIRRGTLTTGTAQAQLDSGDQVQVAGEVWAVLALINQAHGLRVYSLERRQTRQVGSRGRGL